MTSATFVPVLSADTDDREALGTAIAAQIAHLPHRPRLLGFGEPMHGEDEFLHVRNAIFAALVDQLGFTCITLESCAWNGRLVDAYVRGGDGVEDDIMAAGFTHTFGESLANRMLVRWMREQNRTRPPAEHLRFAGFDIPSEMMWTPSPRPELEVLHTFLQTHVRCDLPSWDTIDRLLGAEEPWREPDAAMNAASAVGDEPRVHHLRAITDDLCWTLNGEVPRLRREVSRDDLDDALLAGRTAASLLAFHAAMAHDTGDRWERAGSIRDTAMADNLAALADRGPTLVFAHNHHLRTGTLVMAFGPMTLRFQPAGAHVAQRLGSDYHIIGSALGEATHHDIQEPSPDTIEGVLHHGLPPGNHLLSASELTTLQHGLAARVSPTFRYAPMDDTLIGEIDQLLFVQTITPE